MTKIKGVKARRAGVRRAAAAVVVQAFTMPTARIMRPRRLDDLGAGT